MSHSLFVSHVLTTLEHWGVEVELSAKQQVHTPPNQQGLACSGFFTETPYPKLAVATGKNEKECWPFWHMNFLTRVNGKSKTPFGCNFLMIGGMGEKRPLMHWIGGLMAKNGATPLFV